MKKNTSRRIANSLKKSKVLMTLYRCFFNTLFKIIGIFIRVNMKTILFVSYGGDSFNDSPKTIYDEIIKDPFFKQYRKIWAFNYNQNIFEGEVVKIDSLKYFILAMKSGIWVTNVNIERGLSFKKKKTFYINTWHGTPIKKIGNAVKNRKDYNFSKVNLVCSDGEFLKKIFIEYFNANEKSVSSFGRPREDYLHENNTKEYISHLKKNFNFDENKKIILYVPTWRNKKINIFLDKWHDILGNDYIILVRTHHLDVNNFTQYINNKIIDVSNYNNINDLYLASDYLISDYSSAFFDFGLLGKPIFCLAPDYDIFLERDYLFFDLRSYMPNGVYKDYKDMLSKLKKCNYAEESKKSYIFASQFANRPDNATKKCIDEIKKYINKGYRND